MKTLNILALVSALSCSALTFAACSGDPGQTTATSATGSSSSGEGGFGGQGGMSPVTSSSVSTSSSSSSSGSVCEQPKTCDYCLTNGCKETGEVCLEDKEFWKYQNVASCISTPKVQQACPQCQQYSVDRTINEACLTCAAKNNYSPFCQLDCESCTKFDVLATCEECKQYGGCEFNQPHGNQCYGGVVAYTDMIGCIQQTSVQANCPACQDEKTVGDIITQECVTCAEKHAINGCTFSCAASLGLPE